MKTITYLISGILLYSTTLFAQAGINTDNSAPDNSAMLDVKSFNKGFLPPRMTQAQRDAIITPVEGLIVYNTSTHKPNYWQGTVWMNYDNTMATSIGEPFRGGVLAYILQPGDPGYISGEWHGLIAAPGNQSTGAQWGCYGTTIGGTATALGTGQANTTAIVNGCPQLGIAARICNDLVMNGYSDWYLPSQDELSKLYNNRYAIGGFAGNTYWSSSESGSDYAGTLFFGSGSSGPSNKTNLCHVRAVRAF